MFSLSLHSFQFSERQQYLVIAHHRPQATGHLSSHLLYGFQDLPLSQGMPHSHWQRQFPTWCCSVAHGLSDLCPGPLLLTGFVGSYPQPASRVPSQAIAFALEQAATIAARNGIPDQPDSGVRSLVQQHLSIIDTIIVYCISEILQLLYIPMPSKSLALALSGQLVGLTAVLWDCQAVFWIQSGRVQSFIKYLVFKDPMF